MSKSGAEYRAKKNEQRQRDERRNSKRGFLTLDTRQNQQRQRKAA